MASSAPYLDRYDELSGDSGCVEVALDTPLIGVRDTKNNGTGPILTFRPSAWAAFLDGLRSGEFTPDRIDN